MLIDKEKLMEKIGIKQKCEECKYNGWRHCTAREDLCFPEVCEAICGAPEVVPKEGTWLVHRQLKKRTWWKCSECGAIQYPPTPYCSYCGAKMKRETVISIRNAITKGESDETC